MNNDISFELINITIALYLISKTHLLMIALQPSSKLVRVYVIFAYREASSYCIATNYYSTYSNLSTFSTVFQIRISFNLKYEMDSFE
jgi:hypothetical protein